MTDEISGKPRLDPPSAGQVAEFMLSVRAVTAGLWVVPAVVVINVAAFALMSATGVDALSPDAERVLAWGANYGPKTLGGEPWRLIASMFVHFGAVHLLMNMLALADAGRLVERIFGHARFAAIYLVAGLSGSVASLVVHPQVVSAGASGAVFGVYGALGAFLLRQRGAIPGPVLSRLSRIALGFIAYNVLYGFTQPNIDAAAHVGGALAGAVVGAYLVRPLAPGRTDTARPVAIVAVACASLVTLASLSLAPLVHVRLTSHQLPGFSVDVPSGEIVEERAEYQAGKLMVKPSHGMRSGVVVIWQVGAASRREVELAAKATAPKIGATPATRFTTSRGPGGVSVETAEISSDRGKALFSTLPRGKRAITLVTIGAFGVDELHGRILTTISCRPDMRAEGDIGVVPVKLDLPGWSTSERSGGQLALSDGRSVLLLRTGVVSFNGNLGEVLTATYRAAGEEVTFTPSGTDVAKLTGTFQGNHVDGWARRLRCPGGAVLLVLFAPDPETADRIGALTSSARCAEKGEPPSSWPDLPKPATP